MVQDTSREAYYAVLHGLPGRRRQILMAMMEIGRFYDDCTAMEIARYLNRPRDVVSPRLTELAKTGKVLGAGTRRCRVTGFRVKAYRVAPELLRR